MTHDDANRSARLRQQCRDVPDAVLKTGEFRMCIRQKDSSTALLFISSETAKKRGVLNRDERWRQHSFEMKSFEEDSSSYIHGDDRVEQVVTSQCATCQRRKPKVAETCALDGCLPSLILHLFL